MAKLASIGTEHSLSAILEAYSFVTLSYAPKPYYDWLLPDCLKIDIDGDIDGQDFSVRATH